jgi:hypothetical protein
MKPTINGKKDISTKPSSAPRYSTWTKNFLDIPKEVAKELEEMGHEGRWISLTEFSKNGNFHNHGWVPFRPKTPSSENSFHYGNNPDGIIRRKELVLASRPKEICELHREDIQQRTNRQSHKSKAAADELRRMAREKNFATSIVADDADSEE